MNTADSSVWVAGEALIDLVPTSGGLTPIVGGGPANTAKALAKLGIATSFIGGISNDFYGVSIKKELEGIDLSLSLECELPTALAEINLSSSGSASYQFKLENTATFNFQNSWLPMGSPRLLYTGSLATLVEPGASALYSWARRLSSEIVLDPNVRRSVLNDVNEYRKIFELWASISKVVKMSMEDLDFLGFVSGEQILDLGPELVVVTKGAEGIEGFTQSDSIWIPGERVLVVDTVGAGDTVGAIIVEGIVRYGLQNLRKDKFSSLLRRAVTAASITCSRAGANPPSANELNL